MEPKLKARKVHKVHKVNYENMKTLVPAESLAEDSADYQLNSTAESLSGDSAETKRLFKLNICDIMKAEKISLDQAKTNQLFYFVANVIVYRESDGRCLIMKRSEKENVHPGKYCVPGGKLDWADLDIGRPTRMNGDVYDFENALENLLIRETKEEAGLEVAGKPIYINSVAYVGPKGIPAMMVKFVMKYKSGEVVLEKDTFSDWLWVNESEIKNYDCIAGIPEEVSLAINLMKKGF